VTETIEQARVSGAGPLPWRPLRDEPLRHGYTLADANRLSMVAVRQAWGRPGAGIEDCAEVAWFAIVEHIYTATERPGPVELLRAATREMGNQAKRDHQFRGIHDYGIRPGFTCYWLWASSHSPSPERRVTERIAVQQIWPLLLPRYQRAFTALAVYGDYQLAADALGKPYRAFVNDISRARRAFLALWHEGESPSRPWGHDRRADRTEHQRGSITNRTIERRRRERAKRAATDSGIASTGDSAEAQ
jgi:DNA-directed RNA polymerase specialized sigma24 family protein